MLWRFSIYCSIKYIFSLLCEEVCNWLDREVYSHDLSLFDYFYVTSVAGKELVHC